MRLQSLQDLHASFPDIDGFWNMSNFVQTETKIRALLPAPGEIYHAPQVEAMTQLIRLYSLQGRQKEAQAALVEASRHLEKLTDEDRIRPEIRYDLEEGRHYCLSMSPSRAFESFTRAWKRAEKAKLTVFLVDAAYMFSITLPPKQGKAWLQKAIQVASAEVDQEPLCRMWLSHLYMMEGWQSFDAHDYEAALGHFEQALSKADLRDSADRTQMLKWCQGRALRALGQIEKALNLQENLKDELAQTGGANGHVELEIAECYMALHETEKARGFYELAREQLKKNQWYSDNHDDELARMLKNSKKN